jgi:hypothetical protein
MLPKENYTPFAIVGFILSTAIFVVFQIYLIREPARIIDDMEADRVAMESSEKVG